MRPSIDVEPPALVEEGFEDVGLHDESKPVAQPAEQPKKRGFFSKLTESQEATHNNAHPQLMSRFIPSRKRAQSGQGSELGSMQRMSTPQPIEAQ